MFWVLLVACSGSSEKNDTSDSVDPLTWSVMDKGPYNVGYRQTEISYATPLGEHTTPVHLWYPTEDTDGESAMYINLIEDTEAFAEATLAPTHYLDGYPLFVFSHGSFLYGPSSNYLMRYLATHGWVVAAPDHVGNMYTEYGSDLPLGTYYQRPMNDSIAIDAVENEAFFDGTVNTEQAVIGGFSFGAYDVWASVGATMNIESIEQKCDSNSLSEPCTDAELELFFNGFLDSRFVAGIPMAGANRFDWIAVDGMSTVNLPVLLVSGTEDGDNPDEIWNSIQDVDLKWLSITDGCHQMFSVGGCPNIDIDEGFRIINIYNLAFARRHLLGDESVETTSILDGTTEVDSRAVIE